MNQKNVLSVLGCAGSLAVAIAVAGPASASTMSPVETSQFQLTGTGLSVTPTQDDALLDALGCSCATCQTSQQQTSL
ncbi:MAG: hypothetical protein ACTS2F_30085 [Thainema sp.]